MSKSLILCSLDPQALFVLFVLRPIFVDKLGWYQDKFVPGPPRRYDSSFSTKHNQLFRFAQGVGAVFAAASLALFTADFYYPDRNIWIAGYVFAGGLFMAAFLAIAFNFCLGCWMFSLLIWAGIVPSTVCESCNIQYLRKTEENLSESA